MKQTFLCNYCEYDWRGCHNPKRPNVTPEEGCKDFWKKGKQREHKLEKLNDAWVEGLDLSGFKKAKKPKSTK